ncbi:unnamed protein product, partial [Brachionus calyciflorus]
MDYKQKILIGLSPRQNSGEYYNQQQRNLLGFGIYFMNADKKIDCINYDLIYKGNQKASTTVAAFKFLRQQEFFKKIEKKKLIIWSDTGPHFRCSEVVDYFMDQLSQEKIS